VYVYGVVSEPAAETSPPHPDCNVPKNSASRPRTHSQAGHQVHDYLLVVVLLASCHFCGSTVDGAWRSIDDDRTPMTTTFTSHHTHTHKTQALSDSTPSECRGTADCPKRLCSSASPKEERAHAATTTPPVKDDPDLSPTPWPPLRHHHPPKNARLPHLAPTFVN